MGWVPAGPSPSSSWRSWWGALPTQGCHSSAQQRRGCSGEAGLRQTQVRMRRMQRSALHKARALHGAKTWAAQCPPGGDAASGWSGSSAPIFSWAKERWLLPRQTRAWPCPSWDFGEHVHPDRPRLQTSGFYGAPGTKIDLLGKFCCRLFYWGIFGCHKSC